MHIFILIWYHDVVSTTICFMQIINHINIDKYVGFRELIQKQGSEVHFISWRIVFNWIPVRYILFPVNSWRLYTFLLCLRNRETKHQYIVYLLFWLYWTDIVKEVRWLQTTHSVYIQGLSSYWLSMLVNVVANLVHFSLPNGFFLTRSSMMLKSCSLYKVKTTVSKF